MLSLGKSRTLDCVIYKSLNNSSYELSIESLKRETFPLLTCSRSTQDALDDSTQYAMNSKPIILLKSILYRMNCVLYFLRNSDL